MQRYSLAPVADGHFARRSARFGFVGTLQKASDLEEEIALALEGEKLPDSFLNRTPG